MKAKSILWIRKYDCGHIRPTNLAFISGDYSKPLIGGNGYCRQCMKDVKIIGVRKACKELTREVEGLKEEEQQI